MKLNTIGVLGAGWLGRPLIQKLLDTGYKVKAASRTKERLSLLPTRNSLQLFEIDVQPENILGDIQSFLDVDILIINIPPNRNGPAGQLSKLVREINNSKVKQVIFISSTSAYAPVNQVLEEDNKLENPDSIMFQLEELFRNDNRPVIVLRLAGLMGPGRFPGRFFKGRKSIDAGSTPVNMLHLTDAIEVIFSFLRHLPLSDTFNVCAGTHPTRADFYTLAMKRLSLDLPVFNNENSLAYRIVSNEKLCNYLNYEFQVNNLLVSLEQDHLFE